MTTHKHQPRSQPHKSTIGSEFGTKMNAAGVIADGQRERMIAEAAYYMAEHRHFQGGDPTSDWLQAQSEIDRKIKSTKS